MGKGEEGGEEQVVIPFDSTRITRDRYERLGAISDFRNSPGLGGIDLRVRRMEEKSAAGLEGSLLGTPLKDSQPLDGNPARQARHFNTHDADEGWQLHPAERGF